MATVIEKYRGSTFVGDHIYGAWWFSALWGVLTVAACAYMLKRHLYRRVGVFLLHMSFVVILAGALVTHLTTRRDTIHLRTGQTHKLSPATSVTLKEFRIVNYPGTDAPMDYQSHISFKFHDSGFKGSDEGEVLVSMNHIGHIDDYRLFQQSYDTDGAGVTLGVSYDPYGIAITYTGYLLLLLGIIATLLSRKTQMRALYHKAITMVLLFFTFNTSAVANSSLPIVDADIAQRMGTIQVLYNNRICPLNTVATDFAIKITGSASWHGYSADQIFFSWMIYYEPWERSLTPDASPRGEGSSYSKDQKKAAERRAIVEMFYSGQFTKIFPYPLSTPLSPEAGGEAVWFSRGSQVLPREIPVKEQFFIKQSMDFLTEAIVTGQHDRAIEIIEKIKLFQHDMIGNLLPSENKTRAELFYNKLRSIKFPILITLQLGLRWWLSGHIPLSNGYETMLFMAWVLLVLTAVLFRKFRIILWIGPTAALCCLLVAMMAGSSSQITPLMPVLQSPLLSFHVMTVMCAYALFAIQMFIGLYAVLNSLFESVAEANSSLFTLHFSLEKATALSQLLLYPAVFLLAIGIFLGAVWANVSWGCYWSWDPKESWALITLMVYAVPLHTTSIPLLRQPRYYHLYMVCAFLSVVITYFGVNYVLGGMHSYA